jgi:hypothetical protein
VAVAAPPTDTVVLRATASDALRALAAGGDSGGAPTDESAESEPRAVAGVRAELVGHLARLLASLLAPPVAGGAAGGDSGDSAPLDSHTRADALGGEFLLLHLLSAVTARTGERLADAGGLVLGKLSLCLSGFPDVSACEGTVPVQASIATPARQAGCGGTEAGAAAGAPDHPADGEPAAPLPTYTPVLPLPAGASPAGRALAGALGALLPRVALLPLRIDNLNALPWVPAKRPRDAKLRAGLLQLAPGAQVVLDETVLTGGTLAPAGVGALGALRSLARSATLAYSFPFCELTWPAEPRLLVLAHRRPLVYTCDVTLPLRPSRADAAPGGGGGDGGGGGGGDGAPHPPHPQLPLSPAFLRRARGYLATVAALPFTLPGAMSEAIQDDWVEARRVAAAAAAAAAAGAAGEEEEEEEGAAAPAAASPGHGGAASAPPAAVTQEDLHRWLTLARLAALSFGERALTPQRWAWVRALEAARAARGRL